MKMTKKADIEFFILLATLNQSVKKRLVCDFNCPNPTHDALKVIFDEKLKQPHNSAILTLSAIWTLELFQLKIVKLRS